jgi:serine protease Do
MPRALFSAEDSMPAIRNRSHAPAQPAARSCFLTLSILLAASLLTACGSTRTTAEAARQAPSGEVQTPFRVQPVAALLPAVAAAPVQMAQLGPPPGAPATFADLAERQLRTVVNISTTQQAPRQQMVPEMPEMPDLPPGSPFEEFFRDFWGRQQDSRNPNPRPVTSLGSGFIIDAGGLIVTNNHVVAEADEINVILHDETALEAEIVGSDPMTDIAVLKVDAGRPLDAVVWGDSDAVRVGDWVLAIGNPFGLGGTVTSGILSARARDINQGPYDEYLQTDAAINRGNSGGPLYDMRGQVVGINTAIFSPTGGSVGIGFAVPSSLARPVVADILRYGAPRRGWLGVQVQTVTRELAESLRMDADHGALVTTVTPDSPADQAGIRQGDVILGFGDHPVETMRELPRMVASTEIGSRVPVELMRGGERQVVQVTVGDLDNVERMAAIGSTGEMPGTGGGESSAEPEPSLGLTLAPIDESMRQVYGIPEGVRGVVITELAEGSPAAEQGIEPGDVIVEVGSAPVENPDDVARQVTEARREGRRNLLVLLNRQGDVRFVPLTIETGRG